MCEPAKISTSGSLRLSQIDELCHLPELAREGTHKVIHPEVSAVRGNVQRAGEERA